MTHQNENKNEIKDMTPQLWNRGVCIIRVRPQTEEEERRFTAAVHMFLAEWVRQHSSPKENIYVTTQD
jgi:hypothetical protein